MEGIEFWFNDCFTGLPSDLRLSPFRPKKQVKSLQTLAKNAYINYIYSIFFETEFEEKVEEIYNQEKDYIYFIGNFFRRYIAQAEKIVDFDSDEDSDDDSIVLDFYPSSDED